MTEKQVLADLAAGKLTAGQAAKELEKSREKPLTLKVGEKGGVSVYGLQRFPVTLYPSQWTRLLTTEGVVEAILKMSAEQQAKVDAEADAPAVAKDISEAA